ncbi:MAG: Cd(II)/Pb(II)-responsive transcriptional regulator [Methylibium sp.]|uniref:Cd(II)/Pb(II)-responsive transcriptional regulator n=1 Tax=Methylibium sp. TaxID=2067992 RepID=UPI0018122EE7|nr:Cd(II)/Pb(II)-responsive transcriptional regulator [Methylibium sp.]MBA3597769.1 Cd(II)/Pb(II)-responsive transcriptional regulator [Methylibium sp.]
MKIGELAKATRTPVETIRYYERERMLPPAPRSDGNYRIYAAVHAERLAFVRHCRSLDMTLDEIRLLLRLKDAPGDDCGEVDALLDEHIGHVATRIHELRQLEKQLKTLREQCAGPSDVAHCGILNELKQAASTSRSPAARSPQHVRGSHRGKPARKSSS